MNIFEPFRTYSPPRRSAVVEMRATSEPASGSERPKRAEQRLVDERRKPLPLLLVASGQQDRAGAQGVRDDRDRDA